MTFKKILIANRGEIASRIIKTCKKLKIKTVAIYSEADLSMPYVKEADEAVLIGPPQVQASYLNTEKILSVAQSLKVDAIHPGYGFLSENGEFAELCRQNGICFIGPNRKVISAMGSKIHSRAIMEEAGVPVIPGHSKGLQSIDEAIETAARIGYPVMLKASAGGGGIGMSQISSPEELKKHFDSTKTRSKNYFGDDAVFLEKLIESPRHIEVQVAADKFGNIVHLFERECSVQRRNQKVIEETPSSYLTEEQRRELFAAALKGAKAIGYENVGTMEFIFDKDGNFYFLEMNTRLQVEHPITEEVTGIDLVEWQIRLASGERLPIKQEQIQTSGHAIECRVYAEDPIRFFPSPGTIEKLNWPSHIRVDTAIEEGATISSYYDPMIAKLVVHEKDRTHAIEQMKKALNQTVIEGIKCNIPMLVKVLKNERFQTGHYSTQLIQLIQKEAAMP